MQSMVENSKLNVKQRTNNIERHNIVTQEPNLKL